MTEDEKEKFLKDIKINVYHGDVSYKEIFDVIIEAIIDRRKDWES